MHSLLPHINSSEKRDLHCGTHVIHKVFHSQEREAGLVTGFHLTGNLYMAGGLLFIAKLDWKSQENMLLESVPPPWGLFAASATPPPPSQKSSSLSLSLLLFWHVVLHPWG